MLLLIHPRIKISHVNKMAPVILHTSSYIWNPCTRYGKQCCRVSRVLGIFDHCNANAHPRYRVIHFNTLCGVFMCKRAYWGYHEEDALSRFIKKPYTNHLIVMKPTKGHAVLHENNFSIRQTSQYGFRSSAGDLGQYNSLWCSPILRKGGTSWINFSTSAYPRSPTE